MGKLNFIKQEGFSIVELMVALALLGFVLASGYMFFGFGLRTYDRGEQQSIAQQGIRIAADFISSEIRYANEIIISPADISEEGYYYIYQDGDSVVFRDANGSERTLLDSNRDQIAYRVLFAEESVVEKIDLSLVVMFTLEAEDDIYSLDTSVYIMNLNDSDKYEDLTEQEGSADVIKYKKPAALMN